MTRIADPKALLAFLGSIAISFGCGLNHVRDNTEANGKIETGDTLISLAGPNPSEGTCATGFDVESYGATGDGKTDDLSAIQAAIEAAAKKCKGGTTVYFSGGLTGTYSLQTVSRQKNAKGRFDLRSVRIPPGIALKRRPGVSTIVLKQSDNRACFEDAAVCRRDLRWAKMFVASYEGTGDSKPVTIAGLTFDGNLRNQGACIPRRTADEAQNKQEYLDVNLEHQAMISAKGSKLGGRLMLQVADASFVNGCADGIGILFNVGATIKNVKAKNVFRGGITAVGGQSNLVINNFESIGNDPDIPSGLHIEVNTDGYVKGPTGDPLKTRRITVKATDVTVDGNLAITLHGENSYFGGSRLRMLGGAFSLQGLKYKGDVSTYPKINISDSRIVLSGMGPKNNQIIRPGFTKFTNVEFVAKPTTQGKIAAAYIQMNHPNKVYAEKNPISDQSVSFTNCSFNIEGSGTESTASSFPIYASDFANKNNRVYLRSASYGLGFTDVAYFSPEIKLSEK